MKWFILALALAACSRGLAAGTVVSKDIIPAHTYQHTAYVAAGKGVLIPITSTRFAPTAYYICTVWHDKGPDCGEVGLPLFNALHVGDYYGGAK